MITYTNIARVRREVENILMLVYELEGKGIPKEVIINSILNESRKVASKDDGSK